MTNPEENNAGSGDSTETKGSGNESTSDDSQPGSSRAREDKSRYRHDTDEQERLGASKTPKQIIRECLNKLLSSIDDLKNFCFDNFEDIHREIKKEDDHKTIVTRIMQHCYANACMDRLWECIKVQSINQHQIYYPMWELAKKKWERAETATNDLSQFRGSESARSDESPVAKNDKVSHVLLGDDRDAINKWFHNELSPEEKSMVLTVALFEGLNRKHIVSISKEIQRELFETM